MIYINHFIDNIYVSGKENIPVGPKIIVANQPNTTDGLMLPLPLFYDANIGAKSALG
jgi:1-acyl-sn-glycerol-3-phosphate acyltransferase